MTRQMGRIASACLAALSLAACSNAAPEQSAAGFDQIAGDDTVYAAGNEPFWSTKISGGLVRYKALAGDIDASFPINRFTGNSGLGFSGEWEGQPFDLTVTSGACDDTMAERSYPFTATLKVGDEIFKGCGWSDAHPYTETEAP